MNPIIGSNYAENVERLRGLIRAGSAELTGLPQGKGYRCYFCLNPIQQGSMLIETQESGESGYPLDDQCIENARNFFYDGGIPRSMS